MADQSFTTSSVLAGAISSLLDQPNGIPQLDANGNLVGPMVIETVNNADIGNRVLSAGELVVVENTDTYTRYLSVGTSGGAQAVGTSYMLKFLACPLVENDPDRMLVLTRSARTVCAVGASDVLTSPWDLPLIICGTDAVPGGAELLLTVQICTRGVAIPNAKILFTNFGMLENAAVCASNDIESLMLAQHGVGDIPASDDVVATTWYIHGFFFGDLGIFNVTSTNLTLVL